jgi:hypothetical protein
VVARLTRDALASGVTDLPPTHWEIANTDAYGTPMIIGIRNDTPEAKADVGDSCTSFRLPWNAKPRLRPRPEGPNLSR